MINPKTSLTFADIEIGDRVKVISRMVDFHFFKGDTGTVIENKGRYLGITVRFDKERVYEDGHVQKEFNFNPDNLELLPSPGLKVEDLNKGDIVQHKLSGNSYVVTDTSDGKVMAVRSVTITNPDEWVLFSKNVILKLE